jgi:acyl-CoA thioester hydrolase
MRIPAGVHVSLLRVRVGYIDTDRGQVMHHSTYLRYLEHARVEYMRERGIDYRALELDQRLGLPVVDAHVRYRLPARFDDQLEIKTWVGAANRAKLRFDSLVFRGTELLTQAELTLCCISIAEQRVVSMPSALIALAPSS